MSAVTAALAQIVTVMTSGVTPPSDASGGTAAPNTNCRRPSAADAVPATAACPSSASAVAFGNTTPVQDTRNSSGTSSTQTDGDTSTPTSIATDATSATTTPAVSSRAGPTRSTRLADRRPTARIPNAFTPNTIANCCADRPYTRCRTKLPIAM